MKARPPWRDTHVPPLPRPVLCGSWNTPACPLGLCRCHSPGKTCSFPVPLSIQLTFSQPSEPNGRHCSCPSPCWPCHYAMTQESDSFQDHLSYEAKRLMGLAPYLVHLCDPMPGTPWVPGGAWTCLFQPPHLDGCHSTHFLSGHHSPFSTWDLSKPALTVLLPIHSLQVLPMRPSTHPLLPEAFSNPSPGARPPQGYTKQTLRYIVH